MPERVITCEDCGHHEITNYTNQKRCGVCRALKNMLFVGMKQRKCWLCSERFLPIARDDQACGNCAYTSKRQGTVTCVGCGTEATQAIPEVALCMVCARDKKKRKALIDRLFEKQHSRQDTDWGSPPSVRELKTGEPDRQLPPI